MSRHESYISQVGGFHHIWRPKGRRFEVLRYIRLDYTAESLAVLHDAIGRNLTDDLISPQVRRHYPAGHSAWQRQRFGHCVPASFAMLYFLDTDALVPVRGVDPSGEGHWWLADRHTGAIHDITSCQYTDDELAQVYASGRPKGYYGRGEAPAARVFRLMKRVQPDAVLFESDSPATPNSPVAPV